MQKPTPSHIIMGGSNKKLPVRTASNICDGVGPSEGLFPRQ